MEKIIEVARFIVKRYKEMYSENIDEIKLQKLIYFTQKESILYTGNLLFIEKMKAWRLGPVSIKVRNGYRNRSVNKQNYNLKTFNKYIINNVIIKYGLYSSSKLINLTHKERAWKLARKGLLENERSVNNIDVNLIFDEKERLYDTYWDMYCDEFNDHKGDENDR
ncbi:Panacea domain-containing protein [Streptobacillus moniliformis]|uniref:Panacea domain-containing protein n=1 Tax=Streptobacillus moniliformis TaxID=34105 RepID=UPI00059FA677|nr:type II toxin-antitoxin system antitoxin SocA domain-containing protein [Streptobacillus moniliformis]